MRSVSDGCGDRDAASTQAAGASAFAAPETPSRPVVDVVHGTTLTTAIAGSRTARIRLAAWTRAQHAATVRFSIATRRRYPA